jgi:hypothetical protein
MSNKLSTLRQEGKLTDYEYNTYLLFCGNDVGVRYLIHAMQSSFMEEPIKPSSPLFAWHDGRKSVWRDIQRIIDKIEQLLEGGR